MSNIHKLALLLFAGVIFIIVVLAFNRERVILVYYDCDIYFNMSVLSDNLERYLDTNIDTIYDSITNKYLLREWFLSKEDPSFKAEAMRVSVIHQLSGTEQLLKSFDSDNRWNHYLASLSGFADECALANKIINNESLTMEERKELEAARFYYQNVFFLNNETIDSALERKN